jgi:sugar lactone lactonase YvrE
VTFPLRHSLRTILAASCFCAIGVRAQSIVTLAGGRNDEGRAATAAALARPSDVAVDGAGNVYVADAQNNRVRRIDAASGAITTVAGNGGAGFSGDGGPAALASIWFPTGIAFDAANNLYIADSGNDRVRRVDAVTRTITTVAGGGPSAVNRGDGGPATNAYVVAPSHLALDSAGNLYITQEDGNRIRRVDAATKVITTIAGTEALGFSGDGGSATAAMLDSPSGISVAANGDVYFADANNYRIRKIDSSGVISTAAGNGSFGFAGDGGAATDAKLAAPTDVKFDRSGNLYITDFLNNRIRKIDATTKIITTIAGAGGSGFSGDGGAASSATFNLPVASAIDASGNVYVADNFNYRVRRIDAATKVVATIAGGAFGDGDFATSIQILSPAGIAVDSAGNVYISDSGDRRVRRVDAATHLVSTLTTGGSFSAFSGMAVDSSGNLFVIDSGGVVSMINPQTKVVTRVAGTGQPGFGGDGGLATAAMIAPSGSTGIAVDAAGNLFIADSFNNRVRRVDAATKIITTIAGNGSDGFSGDNGPATAAMLSTPQGISVDRDGNVYIADTFNHRIRKVDAATRNITTIAGDGSFGFAGDGTFANGSKLALPNGLFIDAAHNIYIADTANNRVRRIDGNTNIITTVAGNGKEAFSGDGALATNASLAEPMAVTVDASGKVYIADTNNNRVRVFITIGAHRRASSR